MHLLQTSTTGFIGHATSGAKLLIALVTIAVSALPTMAAPKEKSMPLLRESLQVDVSQGRVLVNLRFENAGDVTLFISKEIATAKTLSNAQFELQIVGGAPIDYVGMMVKRGPLSALDYFPLAPHSLHSNQIDITDSYDFKSGKHVYRLSASNYYLKDVGELSQLSPMKTLAQTFNFTK